MGNDHEEKIHLPPPLIPVTAAVAGGSIHAFGMNFGAKRKLAHFFDSGNPDSRF
jgi:hypothetical protein